MSVENALAFIAESQNSTPLRRRVGALKGVGTLRKLAEIGAESGFYFTEDEYRIAVKELAAGELSDASIDAVIAELRGENPS